MPISPPLPASSSLGLGYLRFSRSCLRISLSPFSELQVSKLSHSSRSSPPRGCLPSSNLALQLWVGKESSRG